MADTAPTTITAIVSLRDRRGTPRATRAPSDSSGTNVAWIA
jgi:hypothetical protein